MVNKNFLKNVRWRGKFLITCHLSISFQIYYKSPNSKDVWTHNSRWDGTLLNYWNEKKKHLNSVEKTRLCACMYLYNISPNTISKGNLIQNKRIHGNITWCSILELTKTNILKEYLTNLDFIKEKNLEVYK